MARVRLLVKQHGLLGYIRRPTIYKMINSESCYTSVVKDVEGY